MKSRGVQFLVCLVAATGLVLAMQGCSTTDDPWANVQGGSPYVLTSFPPLYCFAKNVAGDEVAVLSLLTTVGPHDHKPSSQDALAVRKARLFFTNGLGLDSSLVRIVNSAAGPSLKLVNVGNRGVAKDRLLKIGEIKHGDHVHPPGPDPHVWLGIPEAIGMVEVIRDELKEADPKRASGYDQRAATYIEKLKKLQADGKELLKDKKNRNIVTNHDSLAYFARSFDLKIVGSLQSQPGVNMDANHLKDLVGICNQHQVRVIAVEPQYSRSSADTLQKELEDKGLNVALIEIDPVETADPDQLDAGYYERVQRANLQTLAKQLK